MAQTEDGANIVPTAAEVSDGVKMWDQELVDIKTRHGNLVRSDQDAYTAQVQALIMSVNEKRAEQISKLNDEIHQYMVQVQGGIDSLLEDLKSEKLKRLDAEFNAKVKWRKENQDQELLDHLKKYRSVFEGSPSQVPLSLKQTPLEAVQMPPIALKRTPLPVDRHHHHHLQHPHQQQRVPTLPSSSPYGSRQLEDPRLHSYRQQHQNVAGLPGIAPLMNGAPAQAQPLRPINVSRDPPVPIVQAPRPVEVDRVINPLGGLGKRKSFDDAEVNQQAIAKRSRIEDIQGISIEQERQLPSQKTTGQGEPRSISFDEVFQDGKAEYKHIIVEYPPNSNKWYILRCDQHMVHFGLKPLLGAAKHLHSSQHNNLQKHHSLAIELIGHWVRDCDKQLAAKNNAVVQKAFSRGYQPFNVNRLTRQERISQGFLLPESPVNSNKLSTRPTEFVNGDASSYKIKISRPFIGVTNPVPGELYLGYWTKTKTKYAIMVFPFNGDIAMTGLRGTLASIGLIGSAPKCIKVNRSTHQIEGWAEDYEDGGPLVTKREFPVVYFDRKQYDIFPIPGTQKRDTDPRNSQVGWLPAKHISRFNFEDPSHDLIPEFNNARNHYAKLKGYSSYDALKAEEGVPRSDDNATASPVTPGSSQKRSRVGEQSVDPAAASDEEMADAAGLRDAGDDTDSYAESDRHDSDDDMDMGDHTANREVTVPSSHGSPRESPNDSRTDGKGSSSRKSDTAATDAEAARGSPIIMSREKEATPQEIAARALHLSPGREPLISPRLPPAPQFQGSPRPSSFASPQASPRSQLESMSIPRISSLQHLLGDDISPVRQRQTAVVGSAFSGVTASKSLSPPASAERHLLPPRAPSAQPPNGSSQLNPPPRVELPNGTARNGLGVSSRASSATHPITARPPPLHSIAARNGGSVPAPERSPSAISITDPISRKSTPTILRGDGVDKWKAVRSVSHSDSPPTSFASLPEGYGTSQSTPREVTTPVEACISAAGVDMKAEPAVDRGQDYDIVSYQGDGRRWSRGGDDAYLRLTVDSERQIAETSGEIMHITVDPQRVTTLLSDTTDATTTAVEMGMKDSAGKTQRLVFGSRSTNGRLESGKIQARRFCQWVKSLNSAVVIRTNSVSDIPRRMGSVSSATREAPIMVE